MGGFQRFHAGYVGRTGAPVGVFVAVDHLRRTGRLSEEEIVLYAFADAWFQENLSNPPFYENVWATSSTPALTPPVPLRWAPQSAPKTGSPPGSMPWSRSPVLLPRTNNDPATVTFLVAATARPAVITRADDGRNGPGQGCCVRPLCQPGQRRWGHAPTVHHILAEV